MELTDPIKTQVFEAVDITFHGRNLRPTQKLENAVATARSKGSKVVRVYGTPRFVVDWKTNLVYLGYEFSKEITEKIVDGTLIMPKGIQAVIDKETQERIKDKERKRLKNSTKVYRTK